MTVESQPRENRAPGEGLYKGWVGGRGFSEDRRKDHRLMRLATSTVRSCVPWEALWGRGARATKADVRLERVSAPDAARVWGQEKVTRVGALLHMLTQKR